VAVELAEALIFTSGQTGFSDEMRSLLDQALAIDPQLQKGLWLKGIVAFQDGDYEAALGWWERLMSLLEPGSGTAQSVAQQMDEARRQLGIETTAWPGLAITVTAPDVGSELPAGAVLFVIARQPGGGGPPLGAVRIGAPEFPVSLHLDDDASMLSQRPVSSMQQIEVVARLSMTGQPAAAPGDWQSEPVPVTTADAPELTLELRTP
jgi:cytochrome c-type biogenesis protein CcmH